MILGGDLQAREPACESRRGDAKLTFLKLFWARRLGTQERSFPTRRLLETTGHFFLEKLQKSHLILHMYKIEPW